MCFMTVYSGSQRTAPGSKGVDYFIRYSWYIVLCCLRRERLHMAKLVYCEGAEVDLQWMLREGWGEGWSLGHNAVQECSFKRVDTDVGESGKVEVENETNVSD